jgi:trk system potassium uptake protein TrkH
VKPPRHRAGPSTRIATGRLHVDVGSALDLVGSITKYLALTPLVPAAVAVGYGESPWPFLITSAVVLAFGLALERIPGRKERVGPREGYLVVALTWVFVAGVGALPYLLSGDPQLNHPLDAYFEAMSGFTTTGATVLTDIHNLPRGLLIWRQLTQWFGGMGIIVLAIAILPRLRVGGRQLLESELPGPEHEPLMARIRDTARHLWLLYIGLTALMAMILMCFGWLGIDDRMHPFNAIGHALTTLPTGGFSPENRGAEVFAAPSQWLMTFFMLIAGVNFALIYRALVRQEPGVFHKDEEFRLYLGLLALAAVVICISIWAEGVATGEAAIRHAAFQTISMMTTTGYGSIDFALWPGVALMALVGLMFIGGCAGSTSGSVKVARHLLMGRILRREVDLTLHPEVVSVLRSNRRVVNEKVLRAIPAFILLYVGVFIAGTAVLAIDAAATDLDLSVIEAVAAAATTLGNVGPGLGFAGPLGTFQPFGDASKGTMIVLMWMGRLELIPVLVLFSRHYWRA